MSNISVLDSVAIRFNKSTTTAFYRSDSLQFKSKNSVRTLNFGGHHNLDVTRHKHKLIGKTELLPALP